MRRSVDEPTGIDAISGDIALDFAAEVRGRKAEFAAAFESVHDLAADARRASEQLRRRFDIARRQQITDPR